MINYIIVIVLSGVSGVLIGDYARSPFIGALAAISVGGALGVLLP